MGGSYSSGGRLYYSGGRCHSCDGRGNKVLIIIKGLLLGIYRGVNCVWDGTGLYLLIKPLENCRVTIHFGCGMAYHNYFNVVPQFCEVFLISSDNTKYGGVRESQTRVSNSNFKLSHNYFQQDWGKEEGRPGEGGGQN